MLSFSYFNCVGCGMTEVLMIDGTLCVWGGFYDNLLELYKKIPFPESKHSQPSV